MKVKKPRQNVGMKAKYPAEYRTWISMKRRCENSNCVDYSSYGGRGIQYCFRWSSFVLFLEDMGSKPTGTFLDRINNNGNYEPSNCRWATVKESNRNRRNIRYLTIRDTTKGLGEWAEEVGLNVETIRSRLNRGWEPTEAVFGSLCQTMERVGRRWGRRDKPSGAAIARVIRYACPISGCGLTFTSEAARDWHKNQLHSRCWCGRACISITKHLAYQQNHNKPHPDKPDGWTLQAIETGGW